jgi:hypothetical protein
MDGMFGPIFKGIGVAASPKGRRAIRTAIIFAQTEEGRRLLDQARKVATSKEGRALVTQAVAAAGRYGKAAAAPENRERIKEAARNLRDRRH